MSFSRVSIGSAALLLATASAAGQTPEDRVAALEARLQRVEGELQQYKASDARMLSEAERAAVVKEIAADIKARTAETFKGGYNNGFVFASGDNHFQLKLNGLLQTRYLYNHRDPSSGDDDESGFAIRRSELYLNGNAFGKELTYQFSGGYDRANGNFTIVSAFAGYQLNKEFQLQGGIFKAPFMVEELTPAGRQQAVERSLLNAYFTAGTTDGLQLQYVKETWRAAVMVHDGSNAASSEFNADKTDFGVAGRGEWLLAGKWGQFGDFEGWADTAPAVRLGAAVDYESAETGDSTAYPDMLKYTADVTIKGPGWNVFLAGVGRCNSGGGTSWENATQYGAIAQAGVFIVPNRLELFGRYEYLFLDGYFSTGVRAPDDLNIATIGANWFIFGHNAKLTTDFMYLFDALPAGNTGAGFVGSDSCQGVMRVGFSVMF